MQGLADYLHEGRHCLALLSSDDCREEESGEELEDLQLGATSSLQIPIPGLCIVQVLMHLDGAEDAKDRFDVGAVEDELGEPELFVLF